MYLMNTEDILTVSTKATVQFFGSTTKYCSNISPSALLSGIMYNDTLLSYCISTSSNVWTEYLYYYNILIMT